MDPRNIQGLQRVLDRWLNFAPCPGVNVSIRDARLGDWDAASGLADVDSVRSMPVAAPCHAYSITKTFTAIRVLQLVQAGELRLDAPIAEILAEPPIGGLDRGVTLRRLLSHTAGIPNYTALPDYLPAVKASPATPWTDAQVLAATCTGAPDFAPGEGWNYSNTGYLLLRLAIERAGRASFADQIRRDIATPLGLAHTWAAGHVARAGDEPALVPGYCRSLGDTGEMENVVGRYHPGWCLTGLVCSTTPDIARLYDLLLGGQVLGGEALADMTTWTAVGRKAADAPGPRWRGGRPFYVEPGYGLGLMIDRGWPHGGLYAHGGDGPGFNTWAMHLPAFAGRALTIAIFCNATLPTHPYSLMRGLLDYLAANPN